MVAVTTGQHRVVIKDAGGNDIAISDPVPGVIADNTAAPYLVFRDPATGAALGSANDYNARGPGVARGNVGEYIELQFKDATGITTDTSDFTALYLTVIDTYRGARGMVKEPLPLTIANRMTKSTASTINDPRGLNDDPATIADTWSAYLRLPVPVGHNYGVGGYALLEIHNNV